VGAGADLALIAVLLGIGALAAIVFRARGALQSPGRSLEKDYDDESS
jgi:hypothetical protein